MQIFRSPARRVAHALERGAARDSRIARGLSWVWERRARPERPLELPPGRFVIGVAGPVLGGSGATPVAIQLALELASGGLPVAFVSHGVGAAARGARRVTLGAPGASDEASLAAQRLGHAGVAVFAAARRQLALDCAARALPQSGVVVLDGVLQASPVRLDLACLVLDATYPWGAGRCPPLGDLRAPRERLLRASDVRLFVDTGLSAPVLEHAAHAKVFVKRWVTGLASPRLEAGASDDVALPLEWLRGREFGLALALGRPERVLRQLRARGLSPSRVYEALDHGGLGDLLRSKKYSRNDVWVTTPKCWLATQASQDPAFLANQAANWLLLTERVELEPAWLETIRSRVGG